MKNINIKKMIADTVAKNRDGVINALGRANIKVSNAISDKELYELTMYELEKGNPDVIFHLGEVLTETFDWSSVSEELKSGSTGQLAIPSGGYQGVSNTGDYAGGNDSWWSKNKDNVWSSALTVGTSFLGGLFGNKDKAPTTVTPPSSGGGNNTAQMMMMMQQQQQQAEARRRREEEERRRSNMMIFGIVGGVLVIGTIITVVALKKK